MYFIYENSEGEGSAGAELETDGIATGYPGPR